MSVRDVISTRTTRACKGEMNAVQSNKIVMNRAGKRIGQPPEVIQFK